MWRRTNSWSLVIPITPVTVTSQPSTWPTPWMPSATRPRATLSENETSPKENQTRYWPKPGRFSKQDPSHLLADRLDQPEFFVGVALAVRQPGSEQILITAEQGWFVFGNHPFDPVGSDNLEVSQVADDFQGGPLAGDGSGEKLLVADPGNSPAQDFNTGQVVVNECHRFVPRL